MTQKKAAASASGRAKAADAENSKKTARLAPYRFKPGQSGNPGGRPKKDLSAAMAEQIFEEHFEVIKRAMIAKLRKGDVKAFDALAARKWGKAHQQVDLTGQMNVSVVIDI